MRQRALFAAYLAAAAIALAFLLLPIVAIFARTSPTHLVEQLSNPVVRDAFVVSIKTTLIAQALIVAFGTPLAFLLASGRFRGRALAVTLVELPLVLPPAVAGIGLLAAFGRLGLLGSSLDTLGITLTSPEFTLNPAEIRSIDLAVPNATANNISASFWPPRLRP